MSQSEPTKPKLIIDDDWKTRVQAEKEQLQRTAQTKEQPPQKATEATGQDVPAASFATLVTSLATQALMMLGQIRDPEGKALLELGHAKHLIDTLGMLQQKTAGNLTPDEAMMLENVLHELRMLYVGVSKRP